jgi:hypothetical protein
MKTKTKKEKVMATMFAVVVGTLKGRDLLEERIPQPTRGPVFYRKNDHI